jgi:hypothetical protein
MLFSQRITLHRLEEKRAIDLFPCIITMDLGEIGWGCVDWIGLTQDRDKWRALVKAVMNLQVT